MCVIFLTTESACQIVIILFILRFDFLDHREVIRVILYNNMLLLRLLLSSFREVVDLGDDLSFPVSAFGLAHVGLFSFL